MNCRSRVARSALATGEAFRLKEQRVAACNWGFVAGKTQTIYPWDSWTKTCTSEPPVWFHDIFRGNDSACIPKEMDYIRTVSGKTGKQVMPQKL
jgi:hypothetical protein